MGFLGLVPADKLAASYDSKSRKLKLYAEGAVQNYTGGVCFNRLPLMGGLKFELEGWTGPVSLGSSAYTYEQEFSIPLPNPATPSDSVIIVDANNEKGQAVPIHFFGLKPPGTNSTESASPETVKSASSSAEPESLVADEEHLVQLLNKPFLIKESKETPKFGHIFIKFETNFLDLKTSYIDGENMVWQFDPIQVGKTQVVLVITGGLATYTLTKSYEVTIFSNLPSSEEEEETLPLSFLGRVNIAVRLVKEKYSDAQLYEVTARPPLPHLVSNPNDLSHLDLVFHTSKGTAFVSSIGWGEFGPITFIDQPWLEDVLIQWPIKMDITEADQLIKKAGQAGKYGVCVLRHPLYPGVEEPYYIFSMATGEYVFVGVDDKRVTVNAVRQAIPPTAVEGLLAQKAQ